MASGLFSCQADLLSLIEASQSLDAPPNAMALTVTGDSRLPCLSYVRAALSVATALASCCLCERSEKSATSNGVRPITTFRNQIHVPRRQAIRTLQTNGTGT